MRLLLFAAMAPLLSAATANAQQPATPTLDQLLTGVHRNALAFRASVPNLVAEEHVVSSGNTASRKVIDSVFQLRRGDSADKLIESREANGTPAGTEQQVDGPSVATGLFTSGTGDFSPDLKHCYDYQLNPKTQQLHHAPVLLVYYSRKQPLSADTGCPITDPVSGAHLR